MADGRRQGESRKAGCEARDRTHRVVHARRRDRRPLGRRADPARGDRARARRVLHRAPRRNARPATPALHERRAALPAPDRASPPNAREPIVFGRWDAATTARVRLEVDGAIATITNDNPDKHNAFDDDMDVAAVRDPRRAARRARRPGGRSGGARASRSRRAATSARSARCRSSSSHHELMRRGHRGIQQLWDLDAPVIVACKGWVDGRLVPARAAVRHPHRGRGHPLPAARGHLRRDPRHRRRRRALRDVRATAS